MIMMIVTLPPKLGPPGMVIATHGSPLLLPNALLPAVAVRHGVAGSY